MDSGKAVLHADHKRLSLCLLHEKGMMLSREYKLSEAISKLILQLNIPKCSN